MSASTAQQSQLIQVEEKEKEGADATPIDDGHPVDVDTIRVTDAQLRKMFQGMDLFEKVASKSIQSKESARSNRCSHCWHDQTLRCICHLIPSITNETSTTTTSKTTPTTSSAENQGPLLLPTIQVLVLMHYKEYLSAGDDAKLLLKMLPNNSKLFVFGREGDYRRFEEECSIDPTHTLILWPEESAITIEEYVNRLPNDSMWKQRRQNRRQPETAPDTAQSNEVEEGLPILRVIVLDGVYAHARNMYKTMKKQILKQQPLKTVALHPDTVSVYHRAQKSYAASSTATVLQSKNPRALHICTVEAYALLLKELGESSTVTQALVDAVRVNNEALVHSIRVRPQSGVPTSKSSGASKRSRRKNEAKEKQ